MVDIGIAIAMILIIGIAAMIREYQMEKEIQRLKQELDYDDGYKRCIADMVKLYNESPTNRDVIENLKKFFIKHGYSNEK